jgi:hypothetical protein
MMAVMTARDMTEAVSSDVLGIATVSAFSLGLPYAIKAIGALGGWLFGRDDDDGPGGLQILTESEDIRARTIVAADRQVLDAGIHQRGRTIALSLVVPPDTPIATARSLGKRFVMLVKTLSSAGPAPPHLNDEIGVGDYDYIVRVSSPTESVIALGGKATSDTTISW